MKLYHLIIACSILFSGNLFGATITAVSSGNWGTNSVWSCNCQPTSSDNIVIPSGITITSNGPVILFLGPVINIIIGGTLVLNNASLQIDATDVVTILNGGKISGTGLLGGAVYSGVMPIFVGSGSSINGPKVITDGVLPIKLIYFRDLAVTNGILLEWASGAEENFDHYDIGRSSDGKSFTSIAIIAGKATDGAEYNFIDTSPLEGTNYYQLTAVDLDGTREAMQVIKGEWNGSHNWITVYPNPVSDGTIHIIFSGGENGSLRLFDSNGLVVAETFFGNAASCSLQLPATATPGAYFIFAKMDGRVERIKVIVK
ncbi:MAG: T9SS type A sorting domain-containing protein [Bacteroidota bacterium]